MNRESVRTSDSHPIRIATLEIARGGRLGLTFCPGKQDRLAASGAWARDLERDLGAIRDWGARIFVTLMEQHELERFGVDALGGRVRAFRLHWLHWPIVDGSTPNRCFETQWSRTSPQLHVALDEGEGVVIHCRGGLGRTGLVAARLLIERGMLPPEAIARVRAVRPGAIETSAQERYVRGL